MSATLTRGIERPTTIDETNRAVEALIAAPGAPVLRSGPRPDASGWGAYIEELDPAGADLSRLAGAPLLLDHVPATEFQVGVVEAARRTPEGIVATLRFSREDAAFKIWRDVADGIRRQVSIGYQVHEWTGPSGDRTNPTFTATKWTPLEVSIVPIGADPNARFRSLSPESGVFSMTTQTAETRPDATASAVEAERARIAEILNITRRHGLGEEFAQQHIAGGTGLDAYRSAALEALVDRQPTISPIRVQAGTSWDAPDARRERYIAAMAHRLSGGTVPLPDSAREFRGATFVDIVRHDAEAQGFRFPPFAKPRAVIETVLRAQGTSDFPALLASQATGRALLSAIDVNASELMKIIKLDIVPDLRTQTRGRGGDFPGLLPIEEHGEYLYGPIAEKAETGGVTKFGRQISVTLEQIISDDLGGIDQAMTTAGRAYATKEAEEIAKTLSNAHLSAGNLSDGKPVFDTSRGNIAAVSAIPSIAQLEAASQAMRTFKGVGDVNFLNVKPRFLVCSPKWEWGAKVVTGGEAVVSDRAEDNTMWRGELEVVVDPNLSGDRWYMFARPERAQTLTLMRLEGYESGPTVEGQWAFNVDALQMKARGFFGCAFFDWRCWTNPGAAS